MLPYQRVNLTVITINKVQKRPIFLSKNFGSLKSNVVYIRRGSSTGEATPDEIADMGRAESAGLSDEESKRARKEKEEHFWREFQSLLRDLYYRILSQKANTAPHVPDSIFEYRLPLARLKSIAEEADELDLDPELRRKITEVLSNL